MNDSKAGRSVKVGVVQMRMSGDPDENMQKALDMTQDATSKGADVVCLPELYRSNYF